MLVSRDKRRGRCRPLWVREVRKVSSEEVGLDTGQSASSGALINTKDLEDVQETAERCWVISNAVGLGFSSS